MQETPRNQMEEALMKATLRHPDSFLADLTRIGPASNAYFDLGKAAIESLKSTGKFNPELVKAWKKLQSQLPEFEEEARIILLRSLAEGLEISEQNHNPFYNSSIDELKNKRSLSKPIFTPEAILFFKVIIPLLSDSAETSKALDEYLKKKAGLRGTVSLLMTYRPITRWLVENQSQHLPVTPLDNH